MGFATLILKFFNFLLLEGRCACNYYTEREVSRIVFDRKPIQLSWSKPNFTCPHKYLLNRQKVEPNIQSPHNFSIGKHEIKNTFELYGGIKGICTIVFNVRFCRKYYLYIHPIIRIIVRDRILILGEGGAVGEKPQTLYFFLRSKRSTFIFDAHEFHIDYFRTPLPPL